MGKLTYGFGVSVDGYVADKDGEIAWSAPDPELHQYWNDQVRGVAVSLYGRRLYELMSAYWPTADENPDAPPVVAEFARLWRALPKVVFSTTLEKVDWNSRLERGDVVEAARRIKAETDGLIDVGGATLAAPLVRAGLVDEFQVVVSPTAVGGGTPYFPALDKWIRLELAENRTFPSGAVLLRYTVQRA
jgi:dihydrofolate reductase